MLLSTQQSAGLRSLGYVSLFFACLPLFVFLVIASPPDGLAAALLLAASYFGPLCLWALLFSNAAGRRALRSKSVAFLFSIAGVEFAVLSSWLLLNLSALERGAVAYATQLQVSLPTFVLVLLLAMMVGLFSGIFFIGCLERDEARDVPTSAEDQL